jgi:hypothetical protein
VRADRRLWLVVAGLSWALLCLLLAAGGHAPSRVFLPIPRERYYLWQAGFVTPHLLCLGWIASRVSHAAARGLGGVGTQKDSAQALALALSVPIVLGLVVPDLVVYLVFGFSALARLIPWTAPLSALATIALAAWALGRAHRLATGRALVAALAGVLVQALLGAPALR